jgi:hypothetical protein
MVSAQRPDVRIVGAFGESLVSPISSIIAIDDALPSR